MADMHRVTVILGLIGVMKWEEVLGMMKRDEVDNSLFKKLL